MKTLLLIANIAMALVLIGCSKSKSLTSAERSDDVQEEERVLLEKRAYKMSPETFYEPYQRIMQATTERDSVVGIINAFGIPKVRNELVRRYLSVPGVDTLPIDSAIFPFRTQILKNAIQYDVYRTKTGDDNYYNAIYDFRREPWEHEGDSAMMANARCVVMIVPWRFIDRKSGRYFVKTDIFGKNASLCATEKFYSQRVCLEQTGSGFIIGPRQVVTAFHSVVRYTNSSVAVILDVSLNVNSEWIEIPAKNIYEANVTAINGGYIHSTKTYPKGDFAILKTKRDLPLDRMLQLTVPDTIPTEPLYMLGHPDGLSLKIISQGRILEEKDSLQYRSEMHSMKGCSGGPVFSAVTNKVVGIQLGRDATGDDYVKLPGSDCKTTRRCQPGECEGMDILKIEVIVDALKSHQ